MPAQSRSERRRQAMQAPRSPQRSPQRSQLRRTGRTAMPAPTPVDFSQDYAYVRRDLIRIALWSTLLFAGMIAMYFIL